METTILDSRTRGIGHVPTSTAGGRRAKFDQRTHTTKALTGLIADVERELLGDHRHQLGVLERACVEGFAGVACRWKASTRGWREVRASTSQSMRVHVMCCCVWPLIWG